LILGQPAVDLVECECDCFDEERNDPQVVIAAACVSPVGSCNDVCPDKSFDTYVCTDGFEFNRIPMGCTEDPDNPLPPEFVFDRVTGDFGQSVASAQVPPSVLTLEGSDIATQEILPESAVVEVTQNDSLLHFAALRAELPDTVIDPSDSLMETISGFFSSIPIFGALFDALFGLFGGGPPDTLTLEDPLLFLKAPFTVPLSGGNFVIPAGEAEFLITGLMEGERASLEGSLLEATGFYDEELGDFSLLTTLEATEANATLIVDLVFAFDNRPPRANAGADQVLECSSVDLTAPAMLSASASFDLDGSGDITRYSWLANPGTPEQELLVGENVTADLHLGDNPVELRVTDQRGSFGDDTVDVTVEDTSPPVLEVTQPAATVYSHTEILTLDYSVTDVCIGVEDSIASLDGLDLLGGLPLDDGRPIDLLTELSLGIHEFRIDAVDALDNPSMTTVLFEIVATPESLLEGLARAVEEGQARSPGISRALTAKLEQAAALFAGGQCHTAANVYRAFANNLRAQQGRGVDAEIAEILITDAEFVAASCASGG
jgi:hypothetical protein